MLPSVQTASVPSSTSGSPCSARHLSHVAPTRIVVGRAYSRVLVCCAEGAPVTSLGSARNDRAPRGRVLADTGGRARWPERGHLLWRARDDEQGYCLGFGQVVVRA